MGIDLGQIKIKRFADGEIYVQLQESVRGCDVFLVQPTCPPANENLMELLIMIDACRRASAKNITAVIPYFGYARADRKVSPALLLYQTKGGTEKSLIVSKLQLIVAEIARSCILKTEASDAILLMFASRCPGSQTQGRESIAAKLVANLITEAGAHRVLICDLHSGQSMGYFDIPVDHVYGQVCGKPLAQLSALFGVSCICEHGCYIAKDAVLPYAAITLLSQSEKYCYGA